MGGNTRQGATITSEYTANLPVAPALAGWPALLRAIPAQHDPRNTAGIPLVWRATPRVRFSAAGSSFELPL